MFIVIAAGGPHGKMCLLKGFVKDGLAQQIHHG